MIRLEITNYRGEPLENLFIRTAEGNEKLALVFPGAGYRCAMPLLYYATEALALHGYDILHVEYRYNRADFPEPGGEDRKQALLDDVKAAYAAAIAQGSYTTITLVGKSLGSVAMSLLLSAHSELADAVCIWLTPLVRVPAVGRSIARHKGRSLIVAGTADPH